MRSNIFSSKIIWEKDTRVFSTGEISSSEYSAGEFTTGNLTTLVFSELYEVDFPKLRVKVNSKTWINSWTS